MWIHSAFAAILIVAFCSTVGTASALADEITLYVATDGNDGWSGRLVEANEGGTDGPLASIAGARDAIRRLKAVGAVEGPVTVLIRKGTYRVAEPIVFTPEDSGALRMRITYAAHPGEAPVFTGGRLIAGWRREGYLWRITLPEVQRGERRFNALWVNGERRRLARTPNDGYLYTNGAVNLYKDSDTGLYIDPSNRSFYYFPGDMPATAQPEDLRVWMFHGWSSSVRYIARHEKDKILVLLRTKAHWPTEYWGPLNRYYVENVIELLDEPGEWHLDAETGVLSYWPLEGEDLGRAEIVAPLAEQLIRIEGRAKDDAYVEHLTFRGMRFLYTEYPIGFEGHCDPQAACSVSAAVEMRGARFCAFENCEIGHVGAYGLWLADGCADNRVFHCEFHDLGAGGVRVGAGDPTPTRNVIDNNFIHGVGKTFRGAPGVFVQHANYTTVAHNEICDTFYTGVSVGWSWGYGENPSHHNIIEYNHIHHLGQGVMSDMGGIYTLGIQPGTIERYNLIHDVYCYQYGGWGIYTDEGSSDILIENNVVFHTAKGGFHQHYGRNNRIRNNVFAFSAEEQMILSRIEEHVSGYFEHNIVMTDNGRVLGGYSKWPKDQHWTDSNCYWDTAGNALDFAGRTFEAWRVEGHDWQSVIADPGFDRKDLIRLGRRSGKTRRGRALGSTAPLKALGFEPIDLSQTGLYGEKQWVEKPQRLVFEPVVIPPKPEPKPEEQPKPMSINDDFESTAVGDLPKNAVIWGGASPSTALVTDETAAAGKHSLKFTDTPGPQHAWEPEMGYHVALSGDGAVASSFDVRIEPGAVFFHELRSTRGPGDTGPRLVFNEKHELLADDKVLMHVPIKTWFHVEIRCPIGVNAAGVYTLTVTLPGKAPRRFDKLPYFNPDFGNAEWALYQAFAQKNTAFYLDNVCIEYGR
ncbi:MAG TPA: right-handed parallel beta-helix repeat-containing protein [Candidatus Hydrogenedentes bacterium]|nr:right-handed parallel beta-helix repeat-containing protein [Candidatus Hydrogenedentota bacterium]HIJ72801.1 right-handed parallel beta-helix repeat-containing protein [Candidatus Hydrogenedentota bacterium]